MRHMRFSEQSRIGTLFDYAAAGIPKGTLQIASPSPVVGEPAVHSYGQLASIVRELSGWFPAVGVQPGSCVVIAKRNHPDVTLLAAAASRAGVLPALLSAAVPADQARILLDRLRPEAIFADPAVIDAWGLDDGRPWRVVDVDSITPGAIPADDLRAAPPAPARPPAVDEPMVITHTSGTTGVPKLVLHTAATARARARVVTWPIPVLSFRRRDRYAAYLPWNHARSIEFFTSSLHIGCPVLALSDPDPAAAPAVLGAFRPTVMESMPDVFLRWEGLAEKTSSLFSSIRLYLNAFDAMHPRTVRAFLGAAPWRALWLQGYGQSEVGCASVAAYARRTVRQRPGHQPTLRDMGWASRPMSQIRVTDTDTGEPLGKRAVGQLEVRTKGRVRTYVGEESLYDRRVRGAWWTTGDIGYMTRTGRTILQDRHVDRIPGIDSCLDVEDRLIDALPEATEVALIKLGDEAVPVVCTRGDRPLVEGRWAEATRALDVLLAPPIHLPWADVPRTGTFKVRRSALVEQLVGNGGLVPTKELATTQTRE